MRADDDVSRCSKCGTAITKDEEGITKKLINRGTSRYFCVQCLAEAFDVRPEDIREKIEFFKKSGCTLFLNNNTY